VVNLMDTLRRSIEGADSARAKPTKVSTKKAEAPPKSKRKAANG
jgi:hypothetical protein